MSDILVCIEGSDSSRRTIDFGLELARHLDATLVGMAVVDETTITAGEVTSIGGAAFKKHRDKVLLNDARDKTHAWLADFVTRSQNAHVSCRAVEETGEPAANILGEMPLHDITILGRRTNFHFETQVTPCRTRDRLLHQTRTPVVIVPEDSHVNESSSFCAPVLASYDGSAQARRALESFAKTGLGTNRTVHIVSYSDNGERSWDVAQEGANILAHYDLKAVVHNCVNLKSVANSLIELQQKLGASLVVMGAYGRSNLHEWLFGSTTHSMLEKSPVPLFLHH